MIKKIDDNFALRVGAVGTVLYGIFSALGYILHAVGSFIHLFF